MEGGCKRPAAATRHRKRAEADQSKDAGSNTVVWKGEQGVAHLLGLFVGCVRGVSVVWWDPSRQRCLKRVRGLFWACTLRPARPFFSSVRVLACPNVRQSPSNLAFLLLLNNCASAGKRRLQNNRAITFRSPCRRTQATNQVNQDHTIAVGHTKLASNENVMWKTRRTALHTSTHHPFPYFQAVGKTEGDGSCLAVD